MTGTFIRVVAVVSTLLGFAKAAHADEARAKRLFATCAMCHGAHGQGNAAVGAPAIAGLPEWYLTAQLEKFRSGARAAHPRDTNGLKMRPMSRLLIGDDLKLMANYTATQPRPQVPDTVQGNLIKGEGTYQVCQACHGPKAEGNQQLNAPPLVGGSDWYYLTQLKNFKAGIRGGDAALDPNGAAMQGIAATLDEEAMKNVIAYINVLKPAAAAK